MNEKYIVKLLLIILNETFFNEHNIFYYIHLKHFFLMKCFVSHKKFVSLIFLKAMLYVQTSYSKYSF